MKASTKKLVVAFGGDDRPFVDRLVADLVKTGYEVSWQGNMPVGVDWKGWMQSEMEAAAAVLVCFSSKTVSRDVTGIYQEARFATGRYGMHGPLTSYLIPVRFDDCTVPPLPLDGSRTLRDLLFLDLFPESARTNAIGRLVEAHPIEKPDPR
jgi:hypothetical protein